MLQYQTVESGTLELLKNLQAKPYLDQFVLVGGTALSLQLGHRKSVDLDFFTDKDFDANVLLEKVNNDFNVTKELMKMKQTLILEVEDIKVDFIRFKYPFQFPILEIDTIKLLAIPDIAAMKLDAVTGRGAKKDFVDIYYLLQDYSLPELLEFYKKKYRHETIFHVIRSLSYFEDAEEEPDPVIFDEEIKWENVKDIIRQSVKQL